MTGYGTADLLEAPFWWRRTDIIWFKLPTLLPISVTAQLSIHLTQITFLPALNSQLFLDFLSGKNVGMFFLFSQTVVNVVSVFQAMFELN